MIDLGKAKTMFNSFENRPDSFLRIVQAAFNDLVFHCLNVMLYDVQLWKAISLNFLAVLQFS